jgi:hypothetical protein
MRDKLKKNFLASNKSITPIGLLCQFMLKLNWTSCTNNLSNRNLDFWDHHIEWGTMLKIMQTFADFVQEMEGGKVA